MCFGHKLLKQIRTGWQGCLVSTWRPKCCAFTHNLPPSEAGWSISNGAEGLCLRLDLHSGSCMHGLVYSAVQGTQSVAQHEVGLPCSNPFLFVTQICHTICFTLPRIQNEPISNSRRIKQHAIHLQQHESCKRTEQCHFRKAVLVKDARPTCLRRASSPKHEPLPTRASSFSSSS